MPQPYDIQMPDLLGQFYRGKRLAFEAERAPVEAQQNDAMFAQKQQTFAQDQESEMVGNVASMIAAAPPQHRAAIYASAKGKLAGFAQKHGLPLPDVWDDSYLDEVSQLASSLGKGQQQAKFQNLGDGYIMDGQGRVTRAFTPEAKPDRPEWGYIPDPTNPENEVYARREGNQFFDLQGNPLYGNAPQAPQQPYRDAIAGIESAGSGDYSALGPVTKTGDRAYGRYQVMGANIPEWTQAALGRSMTPQEFLASPQAQDAVFDHRFGGYAQKHGPEGAARAWFAGEGGMNKPGAKDSLGTSVADYGRRFAQNVGGAKAAPPPTSNLPGSRPRYKPGANREGLDAKGEMQLRKEYQDLVKEPMVVINAYNKVKAAGAKPSAAGDLSMIFAYMKMLDPNSVVRETEFANAQNAAGVPDRVRNLYNKALSGERLNPNQRADFLAQANNLAQQAQTTVASYKERYSGLANAYGMAPERIAFSPYDEPAAPAAKSGPQPGDVEDGYQFKGGDPSNPNSWVKASP